MIARLLPDPVPVAVGGTAPLPPGTMLQGLRIVEVVGQGGFGLVYRAQAPEGGRPVAIKEYLPAQLAMRRPDGSLGPVSTSVADTYAAGLAGFLEEARLLGRVRHPGLVAVIAAWAERGTAYMTMPWYEGPTLERMIAAHPGGLPGSALRALVAPLLGALATLHAAGVVHRDVSPDNVIVRPDEGAVLLDLGAARRAIGDRVRATTVMLKAGYAPIEQYADDPDCPIGPWSDVYALGAVMHHAIIGRAPPASPVRVMRDSCPALASRSWPGCDPALLEAVDAALAIRPEDRPRSIALFAQQLGLPEAVPPELAAAREGVAGARASGSERVATSSPRARVRRPSVPGMAALALGVVVFGAAVFGWLNAIPEPEPQLGRTSAPVAVVQTDPQAPLPLGLTPSVPVAPVGSGPQPSTPAVEAAGTDPVAPTAARPLRSPPVEGARASATLRLAVTPWAEVWIDGVRRAVTPPTMSIPLAPGVHRIELRNPAVEPVVHRVEARAGQSLALTHRFAAEPAQ